MRHLALNVHVWGEAEQNRLLTDCVGPAVRPMWDAGTLRRFWVDRFDTGGPHILVLLSALPEHAGEVRARLAARLDRHLAHFPSAVFLDRETLEARHAQCRGKHLCSLDLRPGIEPNNVHRWVLDPEEAYVMRRTPGMDVPALRALLGDLALWSIDRLREGRTSGVAVRWAAGWSAAMERAGDDPQALWRYYASTLVLPLRRAIAADAPDVAASLPRLIGAGNLAALGPAWDEAWQAPPVWPGMDRLAQVVAAARGDDEGERIHFVRELAHAVFAQLDQYVQFRIPLSLFAWHRTRTPAAVAA